MLFDFVYLICKGNRYLKIYDNSVKGNWDPLWWSMKNVTQEVLSHLLFVKYCVKKLMKLFWNNIQTVRHVWSLRYSWFLNKNKKWQNCWIKITWVLRLLAKVFHILPCIEGFTLTPSYSLTIVSIVYMVCKLYIF